MARDWAYAFYHGMKDPGNVPTFRGMVNTYQGGIDMSNAITPAEEWRPVAGYESYYEVSDHGRVRSLTRSRYHKGRVLKPGDSGTGYAYVCLCVDYVTENRYVHRLVAEAFVPMANGKPEVNHKNGLRSDNRVENLEWVTHSENSKHAYRELGRPTSKGRIAPNRKLTVDQVRAIREDPRGHYELAALYGVGHTTIGNVKQQKVYQDVE